MSNSSFKNKVVQRLKYWGYWLATIFSWPFSIIIILSHYYQKLLSDITIILSNIIILLSNTITFVSNIIINYNHIIIKYNKIIIIYFQILS